ncbi:MAG: hypothetical protein V1904_02900 [Bacteroidota bacterium]
MKTNIVIFLLFICPFFSMGQPKVKIGMTMDEVKKIYPNTVSASYQNTITLSRPDTLFGLDDEWGYRFENDKLNWIFFHKYIDEITKENFKKCLSAAANLMKQYADFYGLPDSVIVGDTAFVDPYVKHHWGYDVIESQWKNAEGMKISIGFTFMGGKGEYHFIVSINIFDKSYPYFN